MEPGRQCLFSKAICIGGGKPGWLEEDAIHTVALNIGSAVDACLLTRCEWLHMCFLEEGLHAMMHLPGESLTV